MAKDFQLNITDAEYRKPPEEMKDKVKAYVKFIETQPTTETCGCVWTTHPDDTEVKPGDCRVCGVPMTEHLETLEPGNENHKFAGRRTRLIDENPECPVHTKEGFLLGFFEWVKKNGGN